MHRMLPGTRALRTFEAAGRLLNFTQAAKELGLTPAAVSYQIKEIEEQLGLILFVRSSRSMALTPAGRLLFDAATDALHTLRQALARARRLQQPHAPLRLSAGPRFATQWLLPRLAQWRAAHPEIELSFDISDQVRNFDHDEVDVAIRFGAGSYAGTQTVRLLDTVVVAVCSPALLASGQWTTPRQLLGQTLCQVDCEVGGRPWPNWAMWMAAAGVADADTSASVSFADSGHVLHAVLGGSAVGLLELAMIKKELAQGTLLRLFDIALPVAPALAYHLVYPEHSGDRRIAALQTWLLRELSD
ncbi:LysR substrate-binding domain-containing protein [Janthinobacterium psychrotolerans]|uniref:LysR family transcriptional regulator, glycine cleavage system transcriptional activator n=1 Tax=Janthinobacterium psychrotolerans TaxID=1747903 RepID=A0A1A7BZJ7_9BURK|nr:LysR substrate-binding domain-containing protein [Janthinobacterium psychrotolerans]OBV39096.1 LysR family transcriptional regulator, glycine cleavage system transcriptional activator [Janthinobacterium psychrotolerans]